MQLNSLQDVLADQLGDLLSAEQQLVTALPRMAQAASNDGLRTALSEHLEQTRGHVQRLEQIQAHAGFRIPIEHCEGMEGLIKEGSEILGVQGDPAARDAALIAAAQRVEHYEIAAYGTARALADELGLNEAKGLLDQTLDEESAADKLLTRLATGGLFRTGVNEAAATR